MLRSPNRSTEKLKRFSFQPDFIAANFADINFDELAGLGIRAVFVDLDGTVVARSQYDVDSRTREILAKIPMKVYIATNRPKGRDLKDLIKDLNANGAAHPHGIWGKPSKKYFKNALHDKGFEPRETVMIGDRYLQDMLGANRAGMYSLLVGKLDPPANWFDRLLSGTERRYTNHLRKRYNGRG